MNTERTEKFVNAIACDLEEGGFRQVSGTTLRRTLATAVTAALPLLEAGNPVSELADQEGLAFDVDDARERFEEWAKGRDLTPDTWGVSSYVSPHVDNDWDVWRAAWKALATTGKQQFTHVKQVKEHFNLPLTTEQVGEVQGDARSQFEAWARPIGYRTENQDGYYSREPTRLAWDVWQAALAARQPGAQEPVAEIFAAFRADGSLAGTAFTAESAGYWSGCKVVRYTAPTAHGIDLGHARVIEMLLTLAETAYNLADNANDMAECENVDYTDFVALSDALDALDQLPDDQPGYTMSEPAKARWALRALIGQRDAAPGVGNG